LHQAREAAGLTLRTAAAGLDGISASTLCRIEKGERKIPRGPVLFELGRRYSVPPEELVDLAGGLTDEGVQDFLGQDLRRSLRGGRLSADGRWALREVHLVELARSWHGASLDSIANDIDFDYRPTAEEPGFDEEYVVYRVPRKDADPLGTLHMMWRAHGLAHVLIAKDAGRPRHCEPTAPTLPAEREANLVARVLLIPSARLEAAMRKFSLSEPHTAYELGELVSQLSSSLHAPPGWIAARLTDESLLGVCA
jgi:transcriptional regulator with XRE-family HTH domain